MTRQRMKAVLAIVMIAITAVGLISSVNADAKVQITGIVKAGLDKIVPYNDMEKDTQKQTKQLPKEQLKEQNNQNNQDKPLGTILQEKGITNPGTGLRIVIDKSEHTLTLVYDGTSLKSYDVEFGSGGSGDKAVEGDRKTPEGIFYVTNRKIMNPPDYYLGSRWLGVSYPNVEDASRGVADGLIDKETYNDIVNAVNNGENPPQNTALGGMIGIHGGSVESFGSDWTWGCVGLKNSDIEDFYGYIVAGTPIIIQK